MATDYLEITAKCMPITSWLAGCLDGKPGVMFSDSHSILGVDDEFVSDRCYTSRKQMECIRWNLYELIDSRTKNFFGFWKGKGKASVLADGKIRVFACGVDCRPYIYPGQTLEELVDVLKREQLIFSKCQLFLAQNRKVLCFGSFISLQRSIKTCQYASDDFKYYCGHSLESLLTEDDMPYHFEMDYIDTLGPHHADLLFNLRWDTKRDRQIASRIEPGPNKVFPDGTEKPQFKTEIYRDDIAPNRLNQFEKSGIMITPLLKRGDTYDFLYKEENGVRKFAYDDDWSIADVVLDLGMTNSKLGPTDWLGDKDAMVVELGPNFPGNHLIVKKPALLRTAICKERTCDSVLKAYDHPCYRCERAYNGCIHAFSCNTVKAVHSMVCIGFKKGSAPKMAKFSLSTRTTNGWAKPEKYWQLVGEDTQVSFDRSRAMRERDLSKWAVVQKGITSDIQLGYVFTDNPEEAFVKGLEVVRDWGADASICYLSWVDYNGSLNYFRSFE